MIKDNPELINDVRGVWIQGRYVPIKILAGEFKIIKKDDDANLILSLMKKEKVLKQKIDSIKKKS